MSGYVSGLVLQHLPPVDQCTLCVALVLADQADQDGNNVFPSVSLVACLSRLSDRTVQYSMRKLQKMGFLDVVKKGGGRNNPTKYRINLVWLKKQGDRIEKFKENRDVKNFERGAPFAATEPCGLNGAEIVQKRCRNGEPAIAPDPRPFNPLTPPPKSHADGGEVKEEYPKNLEEHMAAAVWAASKSGNPVRNLAAFNRTLLKRWGNGVGISSADQLDLEAYQSEKAASAQRERLNNERLEAEKKVRDEVNLFKKSGRSKVALAAALSIVKPRVRFRAERDR